MLIFRGISGVLLGIAALPALVVSSIFESAGIVPFPDISTGSITESISSSFIILLTISWVYFLSCVIVFAYNRLKAKKTKKTIKTLMHPRQYAPFFEKEGRWLQTIGIVCILTCLEYYMTIMTLRQRDG